MEDAQLQARDYWKKVEYAGLGSVTYPGDLFKSNEINWELRPAPSLGADNSKVYREELGLSGEEINDLKQKGII
jgi:crotonobetainyl-CoA:carnitine CoA-transferase CaiB-like acyl-CoA transferase